jgi:hypothetical protein
MSESSEGREGEGRIAVVPEDVMIAFADEYAARLCEIRNSPHHKEAAVTHYRKKPVVIEAIQFNGLDDYLRIVAWMKSCGNTYALADEVRYSTPEMAIQTLEGTMSARPGDWIIRGVKGEFYPCKPEVFEATYESVDE